MTLASSALNKIAEAHMALLKLTRELLKEDPLDGVRVSKLLAKHQNLYFEIRDSFSEHSDIEQEDEEAADKIAGFQP